MKGKRFLTRIIACSLSFLMFITAPADYVFAQEVYQDAEKVTSEENEEVQQTEAAEDLTETTETVEDLTEVIEDVEEITEATEATEDLTEATEDVEDLTEATEAAGELRLQMAAVASGTDGDLSWAITAGGALTISGIGDANEIPWNQYRDQIKTATLKIKGITSAVNLLAGCSNLTSVDISGSDFSQCTDMSGMFSYCMNLKKIKGIEDLDTGNVTRMLGMFSYCGIESLDLSKWNVQNVTDCSEMFASATSLTTLNLKGWKADSLTQLGSMFEHCESLKAVDVSGFNTSNVTDMNGTFCGCSSLKKLDISNFDTSKVTCMSIMFAEMSELTALDVSKLNTSNVVEAARMFAGCSKLTTLDVSNFKTSKMTDMWAMFADCSSLKSIDISAFDYSAVTMLAAMFTRCDNLQTIKLGKLNAPQLKDMSEMFADCTSLKTVSCSSADTSATTDMCYLFYRCSSLKTVNLNWLDTSNVTNMSYMFGECSSLKKLDLSKFNTKKLTKIEGMFEGALALQEIDTPKYVSVQIKLPGTYYTSSGKAYTKLPIKEKSSIHLTVNKPVKYKVVFDGNGATGGSMSTQTIKYGSGTKLIANAYTCKGYTFNGWNTRQNGGGTPCENKADGSKLSKKEGAKVILYAQWKKKNYTVTYELKGGTNAKDNPAKYNIKTATITLKNPTRKGYTFKGWYTDSGYKKQITQIKKGSTGNKTLYAKWSANKYTITFDANNKKATGKTKSISCKYGKKYTLTSNGFKRKGYTFAGWSTKKDGSGKTYKNKDEIKNLTAKSNGKVVLYAKWKKKK